MTLDKAEAVKKLLENFDTRLRPRIDYADHQDDKFLIIRGFYDFEYIAGVVAGSSYTDELTIEAEGVSNFAGHLPEKVKVSDCGDGTQIITG